MTAELSLRKKLWRYLGMKAEREAKATASSLKFNAKNGAQSESEGEEGDGLGLLFLSFLDAFSHLYKRVCPSVGRSVGPSVGHTRVEFLIFRLK